MSEKQKEKETNFIPLSEAAKLTGYTPEYLNLLSRKKLLQAKKIGRNWYTKKEWVDEFFAPASENLGDAQLIPLSEAAKLTGYTPEYLNSLSRKKLLQAKKIGRNWHTKKEWLNEFLATIPGGKKIAISEELTEIGEAKDAAPEKVEIETAEEQALEHVKTPFNRMRIFAALSSAIIILPLIFAVTYAFKNFAKNYNAQKESVRLYSEYEDADSQIVNENTRFVKVAGEEIEDAGRTGIVLASENYRVSDLNIGGDIMILANGENQSLEINGIKSESFTTGKNNEVKLAISWRTNKMAASELTYSKNNGQDPGTLKEDSYGFVHSAVVPGLDPGTSYVYQIKCKDRWANEKVSDYFGIYTSVKPVSVFELIAAALGEIFGWAIKN